MKKRRERREGDMATSTGNQKGKMDVYKKLGTPGAPHKLLANMAGSWNTKIKSWMEPNNPPMESTGTCEQKMILGGRFLAAGVYRQHDGKKRCVSSLEL